MRNTATAMIAAMANDTSLSSTNDAVESAAPGGRPRAHTDGAART
jgi:hypothetical protein